MSYIDAEAELLLKQIFEFWKSCRKDMFESLDIWDKWTLLAQAYHNSMYNNLYE